jgi:hypothetical protein
MHDQTLTRTTDVEDKYPDKAGLCACMFNISQIRQLDAGSWFLKVIFLSICIKIKHSCLSVIVTRVN